MTATTSIRRAVGTPGAGELIPAHTTNAVTTDPNADFPPPVPSRTPQLLRRLQVLVAIAVLVAGAVCAWVVSDLRTDLASAPNLAQQYARLGQVQHDIDTAGDAAAKSVLTGETATGTNAKAAVAALGTANGLLVEAAKDRPQDAEALRGLGKDLLSYSLALSAAIGKPLAQATPRLATADAQRDSLLAGIGTLQAGLTTEASTRPWSQATPWAWLACLAMLAVVVWASWVVARLSHRVLNPGLVGAGVALLILLGVAASAQGTAASASAVSRGTQFSRVVSATTAVQQVDAAQRVLTTAALTQTWNDNSSAAWTKANKAATAAADEVGLSTSSVSSAGKAIATQLGKSDWKGATSALTASDADTATSIFLAAADKASDKAVAAAATAPESARATLGFLLGLAIVLALVGAGLGMFGIARRLQEYR